MAWYVVHVGHMPRIYRTWEDCYAQVNRYPGNLHKKYNTEAEALRAYYSHPAYLANDGQPAYYGPINANHGHPLAVEIEEKTPTGDVKIGELLLGLGKMSCFYLWLWSLLFLFGS